MVICLPVSEFFPKDKKRVFLKKTSTTKFDKPENNIFIKVPYIFDIDKKDIDMCKETFPLAEIEEHETFFRIVIQL